MLHLAPRLQATQEQRIATGVDGPDLTRITRFAALLPADQLNQQDELALNLFTLRDNRLPPFYLERLLHDLERSKTPAANESPSSQWRQATSQQRASLLLEAAGNTLLPLQWLESPDRWPGISAATATPADNRASARKGLPWPFRRSSKAADSGDSPGHASGSPASSTPLDPPTRRHAFRAALHAGDSIAHLFASNIIDPIRADTHVPGDPFVQTTLYVIAPLYEPLTSALIWPTIAHQLNYLGQRHIAQVVGIFAAGSYARDSSRITEDASCYAAMAELEALTGLRRANLNKFISSMREDSNRHGRNNASLPEEWLGRPLFDRIYLVDREKSNQGLARNSYELSVLVGNALQSLIAADGAAYVDEQVGIDLRNASDRPYSLLGAAADYVPLDYIFQTAQEYEGKRLLREQVLPGGPEGASGLAAPVAAADNMEPLAPLQVLGATSQQVLIQLIEQMPELFDELNPQSIQQLSAHPDYVLPPATARKLRGLNPVRWQAAFDRHLQDVMVQFEESIGAGALDTAWGLAALREDGLPRNSADNRFLPTVSRRMRSHLLTQIGARPSGLVQARRQLHQWLFDLEQERHALAHLGSAGVPSGGANRVERQLELRDWRARYLRTLADQPSLFGSLTRAFGLLTGIVLLTLLYLFGSGLMDNMGDIIDGEANPAILMGLITGTFLNAIVEFFSSEANAATFIGLMIGAFLGAMMSFRSRARRVRKLRRERVNLACSELTARLQDSVQRGLGRVHEHLQQILQQMDRALEETCETLQEWSVSDAMPPVPPEGVISSHLYRPHLNPTLWERCQTFMRSRQDAEGLRGDGRLREIWTSPHRLEQLAALFTGQFEDFLAEKPSLPTPIQTTFKNAPSHPDVAGHPNHATGDHRGLAETLFAYIRDSAQAAVSGMHASETDMARLQFVRTLAREYNLEHLLWRDDSSAEDIASLYPNGEFTPVSTATLRYLEDMWNTAKPSANYDVSDRLAAYGLPVEFAAVSGDPDSDLTEDVMQSLRLPRLLTGNTFQITFVRTLHGLELKDLGSMARYLAELSRMNTTSRQRVMLTEAAQAEFYNQHGSDGAPRNPRF